MLDGMLERESREAPALPRLASSQPADAPNGADDAGGGGAAVVAVSDNAAATKQDVTPLRTWLDRLGETDIAASSELVRVELAGWLKVVIHMAGWSAGAR
eukprot:2909882-Prymnesium_polylepis.1